MKKKIMVIGAGVYQKPLIQQVATHGDLILVAPQISEDIQKLCTKMYICDVRDEEHILNIAREEKIEAVITDQTDIAVRTVAYVAENMDLPGIGYETAILFTDKAEMRTKCEKIGVKVLPYSCVMSIEEALRFYREIQCDCVLKPVDNQGSRGVVCVRSEEEIKSKFVEAKKNSKSGKVIIEKLAHGREFVVEGMAVNYKYQTLICGDTEYFDITDAYAAKSRIFPAKAPKELYDRVCRLNEKIITGFGLKQGITHSEYIMDGDEIYLIETAARGGGVFISSDLIYLGTGIETEKFLIDLSLGEIAELPALKAGKHCGYMAFFLPNGTVEEINGVEEIVGKDFIHRNLLDTIYVGMRIKNKTDKTSRFAIIVSGDNADQLRQNMEYVKNTLKIWTATENGRELPVWG